MQKAEATITETRFARYLVAALEKRSGYIIVTQRGRARIETRRNLALIEVGRRVVDAGTLVF